MDSPLSNRYSIRVLCTVNRPRNSGCALRRLLFTLICCGMNQCVLPTASATFSLLTFRASIIESYSIGAKRAPNTKDNTRRFQSDKMSKVVREKDTPPTVLEIHLLGPFRVRVDG